MAKEKRWMKSGTRMFRWNTSCFSAVIFGAPSPYTFWAWAVWSRKKRAEGIEFTLANARLKANQAIENAEFMQGMEV